MFSSLDQRLISRDSVYIDPKYSLVLPGRVASMYCTPSGENAAVARGKVNRSILEKGAMDNATPAIANNTRMEKRIALECGKRKPDEVKPRAFRALRMSSKRIWGLNYDLRVESVVNRRNLWVVPSPCAFVVLQIRELILDNCYSTMVVGLTDEFVNLEVLSLIKVGLTNLKNFPSLPNLRRVSEISRRPPTWLVLLASLHPGLVLKSLHACSYLASLMPLCLFSAGTWREQDHVGPSVSSGIS